MTANNLTWTARSNNADTNGRWAEISWHKSSYSPSRNGECVEAGLQQDAAIPRYAMRDSTNRAAGYFTLPAREWSVFLGAVRAHEYDA